MILLFLILGGILSVQYVPEAREYYDQIIAKIFSKEPSGRPDIPGEAGKKDTAAVNVGRSSIEFDEGTDLTAVREYTEEIRGVFSEGLRAASGEKR